MTNHKTKGTLLMLLSACCFSAMMCMLKLLAHLDPVLIAWVRFLVGLAAVGAIVGFNRVPLRFNHKPLLLLRGLLEAVSIAITYNCILHLGVAKGTVIIFSYPVFGTLFGAVLLRERLTIQNFLALGLAMAGLFLLVVPPGSLNTSFLSIGKYELLMVVAAMLVGMVVVTIRKLHQTDGTLSIFTSLCLAGTAVLLVPAFNRSPALRPGDWIVLAAIGLFAAAGQMLLTKGYRYLPVKSASLLSTTEVLLSVAVGILIYHEAFSPRFGIGAVLIVFACVIVLGLREKSLIPEPDGKIIAPVCMERQANLNSLGKETT